MDLRCAEETFSFELLFNLQIGYPYLVDMLPHGVTPSRRYHTSSQWQQRGGNQGTDLFGTSRTFFVIVLAAIPSFLLGTTVSLYAGVDCSNKSNVVATPLKNDEEVIQAKVQELLKEREEALLSKHTALVHKMVEQECGSRAAAGSSGAGSEGSSMIYDPDTIGAMFSGMALTPKQNFTNLVELGVPLDKVKKDSSHVLMLYSKQSAMPQKLQPDAWKQTGSIPELMMQEPLENCDMLNVLLVDHSKSRNQCLALVPQYESYHLHHFMRAPERTNGLHGALNHQEPLRLVSRGLTPRGKEEYAPPSKRVTDMAFDVLKTYFDSLEDVTNDLKQVIKNDMKPYNDKIIIVSEFFTCHIVSQSVAPRLPNCNTPTIGFHQFRSWSATLDRVNCL